MREKGRDKREGQVSDRGRGRSEEEEDTAPVQD